MERSQHLVVVDPINPLGYILFWLLVIPLVSHFCWNWPVNKHRILVNFAIIFAVCGFSLSYARMTLDRSTKVAKFDGFGYYILWHKSALLNDINSIEIGDLHECVAGNCGGLHGLSFVSVLSKDGTTTNLPFYSNSCDGGQGCVFNVKYQINIHNGQW
jgi:hypothetical protein